MGSLTTIQGHPASRAICMSNTIQNYRKICDEAIQLANTIKLNFSNPERIIFAGMGGSGIAGNLVKDVANLDIPIEVSKGYTLPSLTNSNSLVVCISYSGNTEETLYQFVEAVKRKCAIFSISSGGKLLEWSKKLDIPFVQLPSGYEPREALPYLFFSALSILEKLNLKDYSSGKNEFLNLMEKIDLKRIDKIANDIKDSLIFIYGSTEFSGVLRRIKNELNENSKLIAKVEELPELNHNEIVGYEIFSYPNISVIFLRDVDERIEISKRIEITKNIIRDKVRNINEIWTYGKSKLSKVMSLVYQGAYLSFKLAELKGIDWRRTKTIDRIKQELKSLNTVEKMEKEIEHIR